MILDVQNRLQKELAQFLDVKLLIQFQRLYGKISMKKIKIVLWIIKRMKKELILVIIKRDFIILILKMVRVTKLTKLLCTVVKIIEIDFFNHQGNLY